MKVLYRSFDIRANIKRLLRPLPSNKRTVFVAYVGSDWDSFLPANVRGLRLICNPTPGATSPIALAELQQAGAEIWISNRLHAKVYFSSKFGCVVASANLSKNGLGVRGLHEIGVLIDTGVDIDRIWRETKPRRLRDSDLTLLKQETKRVQRAFANAGQRLGKQITFQEWYDRPAKHRPIWNIGMWFQDETWDFSSVAKQEARLKFDRSPHNGMNVQKGTINEDDWLLCFEMNFSRKRVTRIEWVYADFVVRIPRSDPVYDPYYPMQAVQAMSSSRCPWPPFKITPTFRRAFALAAKRVSLNTLGQTRPPSKRPLDIIRSSMAAT